MKRIWIAFSITISIVLCSCGQVQPQEQREQETNKPEISSTKATQKSTAMPEAAQKQKEINPSKPTEDPIVLFKKKNVKIAGRYYTYVDYKVELSGEISLYSLKTKESVLYIPKKIEGKPVRFIEGVPLKYAWQKNKKNKLKKIVVPEGVKEIGGFEKVAADEIILPKSLKTITTSTFHEAQIKRVVLKGKKTNIEDCAFSDSSLEKIKLPTGFCGKMGERCFENTRLTKFSWPDYKGKTEEKLGEEIFVGCKKLKKIIFPENAKHIYVPFNTFWGCSALKELKFSASIRKVTYKECYYADNYKRGVSTLIFAGKNTKLVGGDAVKLDDSHNPEILKGRHFITVKRILAPKDSKVFQFAKKAVKISYMPEWIPEKHISYSEPIQIRINQKNLAPVQFKVI